MGGVAREFGKGYQIGRHPVRSLINKVKNPYGYSPYGNKNRWPTAAGGRTVSNPQTRKQEVCSRCKTNPAEGTDAQNRPMCSKCSIPTSTAFNLKSHKSAQSFILERKEVKIHPNLLSIFQGDGEALEDFMDGLSKHEKSIIRHHCDDLDKLKGFVVGIVGDIEDSAKQLQMNG